tara:strand:- start:301 stop:1482 length:1182 start_codon:yes stop_codon:yes gene_type:complete
MKAAPSTNRIDSLDLIRGVAILGILIMNITSFSQIGMAYLNPKLGAGIEGINGWIHSFAFLFADMRFMSVFSILFGAGMMLFVQNIEQKGLKPIKYHYKRMFLLLGFGLIHAHLIWMGDILVPYAICGCLVFLIRNWSSKALVAMASIFFMIPIVMNLLTYYALSPRELGEIYGGIWNPESSEILKETQAYQSSYLGQMEARSQGAYFLETYQFISEGLWRYSAMMITGVLLFRLEWFKAIKGGAYYLRFGLVFLITGLVISASGLYLSYERLWEGAWSMTVGHQFTYIASFFMALSYISILVFWSTVDRGRVIQNLLKKVGRMAFTNYIMSSIVCTFIFYGHGLGYFAQFDRLEQWGVVLLVWLLIVLLSNWVMKRYKQGPIEFIWRKLTYF